MRSSSDKRDAVHSKSGESVHPSDPGLKGPTLLATAGRKSAACLLAPRGAETRPVVLQPKTGRGVGQSPTDAVGYSGLDRQSLDRLIAFFRLLDEWKRKRDAETGM
jgi:hypothetical protein